MNLNPFKITYKIIEHSNLEGEKKYKVSHGNFFWRKFLDRNGGEWHCKENGDFLSSLSDAKRAIRIHAEKLFEELFEVKMQKSFNKTIAHI